MIFYGKNIDRALNLFKAALSGRKLLWNGVKVNEGRK